MRRRLVGMRGVKVLRRAVTLAVTGMLVFAAGAAATEIQVNEATDELNSDGDCSLREAIQSANGTPADACAMGTVDDEIKFVAPDFAVGLPKETINLGSSLTISQGLTILGYGIGELELNGGHNGRVFNITPGTGIGVFMFDFEIQDGAVDDVGCDSFGGGISTAEDLSLTGMYVANNQAIGACGTLATQVRGRGGGIYQSAGTLTIKNSVITSNDAIGSASVSGPQDALAEGGGIYSTGGVLRLTDTTVSGNTALATSQVSGAHVMTANGGGIMANSSELDVLRSTVSGNTAHAEATGGASMQQQLRGGGINATNTPNSSIELSTIANNTTLAGTNGTVVAHAGGGVLASSAGTSLAINSSTIARNGGASLLATPGGPNLVAFGSPTWTIRNSIVANPLDGSVVGGANCQPGGPPVAPTSLGFNIDYTPTTASAGTCAFNHVSGTDMTADPMLGGLAVNSNPFGTATFALLPGSPAIDAGSSTAQTNPTQDQRTLLRPSDFVLVPDAVGGNGADIGAFEVQNGPLEPLTVNKAGSGDGTVTSSPALFNCGPGCSTATEDVDDGGTITLIGTPAAGSDPVVWSGCDSTAGNQCVVTVSTARAVTATFDRSPSPPPAGPGPGGATGQRAAALKKCKKKKSSKARKKCKRKAKKLPV
jgi:CSLREA domain-containing protein